MSLECAIFAFVAAEYGTFLGISTSTERKLNLMEAWIRIWCKPGVSIPQTLEVQMPQKVCKSLPGDVPASLVSGKPYLLKELKNDPPVDLGVRSSSGLGVRPGLPG